MFELDSTMFDDKPIDEAYAEGEVRDAMRRCGCSRCQEVEPLPVYGTTPGVAAHPPCELPDLFNVMNPMEKAACYRMGLRRRW